MQPAPLGSCWACLMLRPQIASESEAMRAHFGPARYLVSGLKSFIFLQVRRRAVSRAGSVCVRGRAAVPRANVHEGKYVCEGT